MDQQLVGGGKLTVFSLVFRPQGDLLWFETQCEVINGVRFTGCKIVQRTETWGGGEGGRRGKAMNE